MMKAAGFAVSAVAFERDHGGGRLPDCDVETLGRVENRRYLRRIRVLLAAVPRLRRAIRSADLVYASGQDVGALAVVAGIGLGRPLVVEVGDIVPLQVKPGLAGWFTRVIERVVLRRCGLLVVISEGFLHDYYRGRLSVVTPALVIQNKIEADVAHAVDRSYLASAPAGVPLRSRPLRIGYFGLLRDGWSWRALDRLAASREDVEIVFAGIAVDPSDLGVQVASRPNMRYLGPYRSPHDLHRLYSSVDIVWACYPPFSPDDWNLKWGRPNRFYESCLYGRPVVARHGSLFARDVAAWETGLVIEGDEPEDVLEAFSALTPELIARWKDNVLDLPRAAYSYETEGEELAAALQNLLS